MKRIHELTASAHLYSGHNPGSSCRVPPTPTMAGSRLIPLQDNAQGNDKTGGGGDVSRNGRHSSDGRNRGDCNDDRHGNDGKNSTDDWRGSDCGKTVFTAENNNRMDSGSSNSAILQLAKHLGIIASLHSTCG